MVATYSIFTVVVSYAYVAAVELQAHGYEQRSSRTGNRDAEVLLFQLYLQYFITVLHCTTTCSSNANSGMGA